MVYSSNEFKAWLEADESRRENLPWMPVLGRLSQDREVDAYLNQPNHPQGDLYRAVIRKWIAERERESKIIMKIW